MRGGMKVRVADESEDEFVDTIENFVSRLWLSRFLPSRFVFSTFFYRPKFR